MKRVCIALGALLLALAGTAASAQEKLVVSIWGGNWKEGAGIIAKEFTKRTGMEVEFITGGTLDRLAKAKVAKDSPESDVVFTTSQVGFLYQADGLFEKLDKAKLANYAGLVPAADRGEYEVGVYSYVYSPVYRADLMPKDFKLTSWNDLWSPEVSGKLSLPDFDPSHIIIASAMLAGGTAGNWEVGIPLLDKLKPNVKAFYQSDATSQDLLKTGETPVQVMLSINAYHLIANGVPVTIAIPKEGAVVGIDVLGINKGTKKLDAAQEFINVALDPGIQQELCNFHKCSPMHKDAKIDPALAKLPGIFTTPEQWSTQAIITPDEIRAKLLPTWKAWFTENMMQ